MSLAYFDTAMGFAAVMLMLSMLITILVQMAGAVLNLRGRNLLWGVERLIKQFVPEFETEARALAQKVLTHDALSHSFGRYAVAIRPEELMLVLQDLATSTPGKDDKLGAVAKDAATQVLAKVNAAQSTVLTWFNTIMDRTTERFAASTRWVTAIFAFGLAFAMNIDTPYIVRQLSTKPEVTQAVINTALKDAAPLYTDLNKLEPVPLAAVHALASQNAAQAQVLQAAANLNSYGAAAAWIRASFPDAVLQKKLLAEFDTQFNAIGRQRVSDMQANYVQVGGWVQATQLRLAPEVSDYCAAPVPPSVFPLLTCDKTPGVWKHVLGMLVTAMLLSLGAPFWFNLLRNMSNLRPILAGKVDASSAGAQNLAQ